MTVYAIVMSDWDDAAEAWIAAMGNRGDWGREHVLDPAMRKRFAQRPYGNALDVGCGEGRLCRMLGAMGIDPTGVDPTERLISAARDRDSEGTYLRAAAEALPFEGKSFDLVVSCLALIDIADFKGAIAEMARVLRPGGVLMIANLSFFQTSRPRGWARSKTGGLLHYTGDRYMDTYSEPLAFQGMRVTCWHRPLSAYIEALLAHGLALRHFDEPQPVSGDREGREKFRSAPWYVLMEWQSPQNSDAVDE